MNKGHLDARYYRFDFAKVVVDEMVRMHGGEVEDTPDEDNKTKMKRLFNGV